MTTPTPTGPAQEPIIAALIEVARAAYFLADNTAQHSKEKFGRCDLDDLNALAAALEVLDDLPDPPNEAATGPRKAEYWLSERPPATAQGEGK